MISQFFLSPGYVDEIREMLFTVPLSDHQGIYEEFKAHQPEPLNRRFENRRSKTDAVKLHLEKKNQRSHELYPPSESPNSVVEIIYFLAGKI